MLRQTSRSAFVAALAALVLFLGPLLVSAHAQTPDWVEPRALNIVDLAGQVPDEVLRDTFISSNPAAGVTRFVSSEIAGDVLRITARVHARRIWSAETGGWSAMVPLLGQRPTLDHMGSVAPESWVRLYENGQPLTPTGAWIGYLDPALTQPLVGASEPWRRYRETIIAGSSIRVDEDGIYLPGNYGGELGFAGEHLELTAVYTVRLGDRPRVTHLSTQSSAFQSYIGPGDVGLFGPLMDQLRTRFDDRHGRTPLTIPAGADYVLFRYPMIPFHVYDEANLQRPSTGSVRFSPADTGMLSADLVHSGGFPLLAAWQDAGQVLWRAEDRNQPDPPPSERFLSRLPPVEYVSPPEYIVPAGTPYNECFRTGGCPASVLESIHNARMTLEIVYLRVESPGSGTVRIPLRMTDDAWAPSSASESAVAPRQGGFALRIPLVLRSGGEAVRREVPLGVFDGATGRMVDYVP